MKFTDKLKEKFKDAKFNKLVYITAVALLLAIAIIVGITSAANRAKKDDTTDNKPNTKEPTSTLNPPSTNAPSDDNGPADSTNSPTTDNPTGPVIKELPDFSLPVSSGCLSKTHDAEIQVFFETTKDYRVHLGVDIATVDGAPVYAAAEGSIKEIWDDVLMGKCIAIEHTGDAVTVYKNLALALPDDIVVGAEVAKGQLIGAVGNTAMIESAEEPHLHFEMTVEDLQVDPLKYFSESEIATMKNDEAFEG